MGPLVILTAGIATTQFVAWHLSYQPVLGDPAYQHIYWPWRIIEWWQAPWASEASATFQYVKFGLLLACAGMAMLFLQARRGQPKPALEIHGTARFSNEDEIRKSRLWPHGKAGIIVGGWRDPKGGLAYLTDTGEGHVLCMGPTRIGTTASVLLPTLLSWAGSVVVYDPKGELWRLSAGWRAVEAGNVVMRFAPAEVENTVKWNPFDRVRAGSEFAFRDVANIVQQISDTRGLNTSDHWEESAANLLNGVALFLIERGGCSPRAMLSAIDASDNPEDLLKAMAQSRIEQVAEVGRGLLATASRERASIISTARRKLKDYRDPVLAANTTRSDFRIEDLVGGNKPVSLYIEVRGEDELRLRPLVRLFLNLALGRLVSMDPHELHQKLLVAIDEMPTLRRMEPLELFLTKGAGNGIRALLLAQDYQDIVTEYGAHERITAECSVMTCHAPNNVATAKWLSERCGQTTRTVEEISESRGREHSSRTTSRVYRSVAAPLMTPDEVTRLALPARNRDGKIVGPGEMLIFDAGQHPIRGTQSLAFFDPEFCRRMVIEAPRTMRTRA
jgi:type IV secretion system protein VirD4